MSEICAGPTIPHFRLSSLESDIHFRRFHIISADENTYSHSRETGPRICVRVSTSFFFSCFARERQRAVRPSPALFDAGTKKPISSELIAINLSCKPCERHSPYSLQ